MLQNKLLIAMGALTLAACGGSLDLGPKIPAPPIQDDPENGNGGGVCQTIEGETFTYTFGEDVNVDDIWYKNYGDSQIQFEHDIANEQMLVHPVEWISDQAAWQRQVHVGFDEGMNFTGAQVTAVIYVPESYADDSNFQLEVMMQGDQGNPYGNSLRSFDGGDNTLVAGENTWVWEVDSLENVIAAGIGFHTIPADMTLLDPIAIRSFEIQQADLEICEDEPELIVVDFDMTDGWYSRPAWDIDGNEPPHYSYGDGYVYMEPVIRAQQLVTEFDGPVDLRRAELTFVISVDANYLASVAHGVQPFYQVWERVEDDDDAEVPDSWAGCFAGVSEWAADEEQEVTCTISNNDRNIIEEGQYFMFGAQAETPGGDQTPISGTVRFHSVTLEYYGDGAPEPEQPGNGIEASVAEGWDGSGQTLEYVDEGVRFFPTGNEQQLFYTLEGPLVMDGGSFVINFTVDEDYVAGGASVQPFAQGIEDGDVAKWDGCWVDNSTLTAGEPQEYACEDFSNFVIPEGESVKVGLQPQNGTNVGGSVTVHSLVIYPGE